MPEDQRTACREHVIGALEKPVQSFFGGAPSYALKKKALDILFLPKHPHGDDKSTAHLSLEHGNYTEGEKSRAINGAHDYVSTRESEWAREPKITYPGWRAVASPERREEEAFIAQIKTKIGPTKDTFEARAPQFGLG